MKSKKIKFLESHQSGQESSFEADAQWRAENASWLKRSRSVALAIIDAAMLPHTSPASDAAHLGAAFTGWAFNSMLRKGKDITAPVTAIAVWLDKIATRNRRS